MRVGTTMHAVVQFRDVTDAPMTPTTKQLRVWPEGGAASIVTLTPVSPPVEGKFEGFHTPLVSGPWRWDLTATDGGGRQYYDHDALYVHPSA